MDTLHLKQVCWLDTWACAEGLKNANQLTVFIYHAFGDNFDLKASCRISLKESLPNDKTIDRATFTPIKTIEWPLEGSESQRRNQIICEKLADIEVPEQLQNKKLLVLVEIKGDGVWSFDWSFEAISVEIA